MTDERGERRGVWAPRDVVKLVLFLLSYFFSFFFFFLLLLLLDLHPAGLM